MGVFRVYGEPVAQGSGRAFVVKGRAFVAQGGSTAHRRSLGAWRQAVAEAARGAGASLPLPERGTPVRVWATFYLTRPHSAPKRVLYPARKPDADRLLRGVLDALTGIAYVDDAQVIQAQSRKVFATPEEPPGVMVMVEAVEAVSGTPPWQSVARWTASRG